jgi:L-ascorbate metabolism protein UlaG (beta-lactamase superfamily)
MNHAPARITYIGGPTALLELGGLRLLTDPTFDPSGSEYTSTTSTLRKRQSPAIGADDIPALDVVLLSHDHHSDNLDRAGRALLARATTVLTTQDGAGRLGGNAKGLAPWQSIQMPTRDGRTLTVTATPARHGAAGHDRGPVIGFALQLSDDPARAIYVSGDTVWFEGVEEVARRFAVRTAILFMGAAHVSVAGPSPITFTAREGVEVACAMREAAIVPLHFEGWEHFTESRADIERAFVDAEMTNRLLWPVLGQPVSLP